MDTDLHYLSRVLATDLQWLDADPVVVQWGDPDDGELCLGHVPLHGQRLRLSLLLAQSPTDPNDRLCLFHLPLRLGRSVGSNAAPRDVFLVLPTDSFERDNSTTISSLPVKDVPVSIADAVGALPFVIRVHLRLRYPGFVLMPGEKKLVRPVAGKPRDLLADLKSLPHATAITAFLPWTIDAHAAMASFGEGLRQGRLRTSPLRFRSMFNGKSAKRNNWAAYGLADDTPELVASGDGLPCYAEATNTCNDGGHQLQAHPAATGKPEIFVFDSTDPDSAESDVGRKPQSIRSASIVRATPPPSKQKRPRALSSTDSSGPRSSPVEKRRTTSLDRTQRASSDGEHRHLRSTRFALLDVATDETFFDMAAWVGATWIMDDESHVKFADSFLAVAYHLKMDNKAEYVRSKARCMSSLLFHARGRHEAPTRLPGNVEEDVADMIVWANNVHRLGAEQPILCHLCAFSRAALDNDVQLYWEVKAFCVTCILYQASDENHATAFAASIEL